MRYIYLLIAITLLVVTLIIYFQNFNSSFTLMFFGKYIAIQKFVFYVTSMGFFSGMFLVLGIKGILSKGKDPNDSFDI